VSENKSMLHVSQQWMSMMETNLPAEVLIQQFLTKHYLPVIPFEDLENICAYSSLCFDDYEYFKSWWYISNLGLRGLSPAELVKQEYGFKEISHYLYSLAEQAGYWA